MVEFEAAVRGGASILTDGGIETRIMFETGVAMDPPVGVATLVGEANGGPVLRGIYESYAGAAKPHGLPAIIGTPTFRASPNFVRRAGPGGNESVRKLNADAAAMHRDIKERAAHDPVFVAGVIGPSGDAYTPEEPSPREKPATTTASRPRRSPIPAWTLCTRRRFRRSRRPWAWR
jgi:S-methylmethionine-dependent homocysteine/selenocysteine methylase